MWDSIPGPKDHDPTQRHPTTTFLSLKETKQRQSWISQMCSFSSPRPWISLCCSALISGGGFIRQVLVAGILEVGKNITTFLPLSSRLLTLLPANLDSLKSVQYHAKACLFNANLFTLENNFKTLNWGHLGGSVC